MGMHNILHSPILFKLQDTRFQIQIINQKRYHLPDSTVPEKP